MRDDLFLRARRSREADRERGDLLRFDPFGDLQTIPSAALQVLSGDRVWKEVMGRDEVKGSAHEPRADHPVALDRRPELFAPEIGDA